MRAFDLMIIDPSTGKVHDKIGIGIEQEDGSISVVLGPDVMLDGNEDDLILELHLTSENETA